MWMPMQMISFCCGKDTVPVGNSLKGDSSPSHPWEKGEKHSPAEAFLADELKEGIRGPSKIRSCAVKRGVQRNSDLEIGVWTQWNGAFLINSHLLVISLLWGTSLVPGLFTLKQLFHLLRILRSIKLLFQLNKWDNSYKQILAHRKINTAHFYIAVRELEIVVMGVSEKWQIGPVVNLFKIFLVVSSY